MRWLLALAGLALGLTLLLGLNYYLLPGRLFTSAPSAARDDGRCGEECIREAQRRSQGVKGVYMTSAVATDQGRAARALRGRILSLLDATELNAVVVDVKETEGGAVINESLRELVRDLHGRGVWVIARQVAFKDSSPEKLHPDWYLRRRSGAIWRDRRGGSWLDPASRAVWAYQLAVAKAASDAGVDEVQFDYVRFPSDGDLADLVYPVYSPAVPKHEVLREFFRYLSSALKAHRPELILSADLFGYVALQSADLGIGQRLGDIGENFEYVSLMVYPSHYYAGFQVPADQARGLAARSYPYRSADIAEVVSNQPYEVVYRSLLIADDILAGKIATATGETVGSLRLAPGLGKIATTATSSTVSVPPTSPARRAKLRPWLQDFDLAVDSNRGIRYDAQKVRAQIDAAEAAGSSGWLLWNPANVYTAEALKFEPAALKPE